MVFYMANDCRYVDPSLITGERTYSHFIRCVRGDVATGFEGQKEMARAVEGGNPLYLAAIVDALHYMGVRDDTQLLIARAGAVLGHAILVETYTANLEGGLPESALEAHARLRRVGMTIHSALGQEGIREGTVLEDLVHVSEFLRAAVSREERLERSAADYRRAFESTQRTLAATAHDLANAQPSIAFLERRVKTFEESEGAPLEEVAMPASAAGIMLYRGLFQQAYNDFPTSM